MGGLWHSRAPFRPMARFPYAARRHAGFGLWHDPNMTIIFQRRRWVGIAAVALALGLAANVPAGTEPQSALPPPGNQALWTPEQKVIGFRNIARLYGGDVVHHGTTVMPLP